MIQAKNSGYSNQVHLKGTHDESDPTETGDGKKKKKGACTGSQ